VATAPAKAILFGEHAVVQGAPAVAAALESLHTTCTLAHAPPRARTLRIDYQTLEKCVVLDWADQGTEARLMSIWEKVVVLFPACENVEVWCPPPCGGELSECISVLALHVCSAPGASARPSPDLLNATSAVMYLFLALCWAHHSRSAPHAHPQAHPTLSLVPLSLSLSSSIPMGSGLGSSAAFNVAVAAALLGLLWSPPACLTAPAGAALLGAPLTPPRRELVSKWAFAGEHFLHSTPSGIDTTVSTFGGCIMFQKDEHGCLQFTRLSQPPLPSLLVVDTHQPRQTAVLVRAVLAACRAAPLLRRTVDLIGAVSQRFAQLSADAPSPAAHTEVKLMVRLNHHLLCALGVSHPKIDQVVSLLARCGLSAKLTGAGGGGCVIAPLTDEQDVQNALAVAAPLAQAGFSSFTTALGCEGVRLRTLATAAP